MIYDEINAFLAGPDWTLDQLAEFAEGLITLYPVNRKFIQHWLLEVIVHECKGVFGDVVLVSQASFSLDPVNLEARKAFHHCGKEPV